MTLPFITCCVTTNIFWCNFIRSTSALAGCDQWAPRDHSSCKNIRRREHRFVKGMLAFHQLCGMSHPALIYPVILGCITCDFYFFWVLWIVGSQNIYYHYYIEKSKGQNYCLKTCWVIKYLFHPFFKKNSAP